MQVHWFPWIMFFVIVFVVLPRLAGRRCGRGGAAGGKIRVLVPILIGVWLLLVLFSRHEAVRPWARWSRLQPPSSPLPLSPPRAEPATQAANSPEITESFLAAVNRAFVTAMQATSQQHPAVAETPALTASPETPKRPGWIDHPPQPTADCYDTVVMVGPYTTPLECHQALDKEIEAAVNDYVAWRIDPRARSRLTLPGDYARQHLVQDQWLEKTQTSLGDMFNLHALLSFDRQVQGELQDAWKEKVVATRLAFSAATLGGVLLLLGAIYGYLRRN